jgi:pimeloyl-ACP methyl ester carboxylesterase
MAQITSQDGTTIAFDTSGQGPAVILVGGAFQYRALDPRTTQLADLPAADFAVVHYGRRGRGESGDTPPYAVEREVEDLAALIEAAGGSACVFGNSSGGALALVAAARGLAIRKLAPYELPFTLDATARAAAAAYTQQLTALLAAGRRGEAAAFAMTTWGVPAEAIAGMQHSPVWPLFEAVAPTLAYDNAIMGDGTVPTNLAQAVTLPTLVLDGGASPAAMHDAADEVAAALPQAQRRTLAGQLHDAAPGALAPVLRAFFHDER